MVPGSGAGTLHRSGYTRETPKPGTGLQPGTAFFHRAGYTRVSDIPGPRPPARADGSKIRGSLPAPPVDQTQTPATGPNRWFLDPGPVISIIPVITGSRTSPEPRLYNEQVAGLAITDLRKSSFQNPLRDMISLQARLLYQICTGCTGTLRCNNDRFMTFFELSEHGRRARCRLSPDSERILKQLFPDTSWRSSKLK